MKFKIIGNKYVVIHPNNPDEIVKSYNRADYGDEVAKLLTVAFIEGYYEGFRHGKQWSDDD
jgi:hypothetical protein